MPYRVMGMGVRARGRESFANLHWQATLVQKASIVRQKMSAVQDLTWAVTEMRRVRALDHLMIMMTDGRKERGGEFELTIMIE